MGDKNKEFISYMLTCPELSSIYALFGEAEPGATHIVRINDGIASERKYVDGTRLVKRYSDWQINCFDAAVFIPQGVETSENLSEYNTCQAICDWITAQNIAKNFPEFTQGKCIAIEALPRNPQIAGVDNNGIVKYMIGVRCIFSGEVIPWGLE